MSMWRAGEREGGEEEEVVLHSKRSKKVVRSQRGRKTERVSTSWMKLLIGGAGGS